jgi:hypothetical protein
MKPIKSRMKPIPKPLPLDDSNFDPFKVGAQMAQKTSILELHVGKPGFKKSINAEHFISTLEGLSEDQLAALSPEMKKLIDKYRLGTLHLTTKDDAEEDDMLDPEMIHISQDLLDRAALQAIEAHYGKFMKWIKHHAIPSPIRFQGAYLMRLDMIPEIDTVIEEFEQTRNDLIDALAARYEELREDAQRRRGPFYTSEDYPPFHKVRQRYTLEWRWLDFNVKAALKEVSKKLYKREGEKWKKFFADTAQETRDAARITLQGLVDHLLSQLRTDEDGKKKKFQGRSVEKMKEFVEAFLNGGDLTDDNNMMKVARKAKRVLDNVDADDIRKEEALKDALEYAMNIIKKEAGQLTVASTRKFALDEYDDEPEPIALD